MMSLCLFFSGCRDKDWDEYYGRPETLADPIYQQLESKGNFINLLACIDKGGYKNTLSKAGYWTMFAPNDEAFAKFFQEGQYSSIDAIDSATARQLVTYALAYNAFSKDRLSDFQANEGWIENNAYKRRTAYYQGVYTGMVSGAEKKLIAANRNGSYIFGDNNNKYIPYFIDEYFNVKGLTAYDYTYFYPGKDYTGFNVGGASVVNADVAAENGTVFETDQVILPLPSIDQYLASEPRYSEFKELLDKYAIDYVNNAEATDRYRLLSGSSDSVFVKQYKVELAFSPNNENFLKEDDNDGQTDGWTLFAPANEVLNSYIDTVLLEHYTSLDAMPRSIVYDFINAHMWQTTVWPSKFETTSNFLGEEARFDPEADVVDAKVLSNGMFYGTEKVQASNLFTSVYGRVYLDPKYSMMTRILNGDLKFTISNPNVRFTLFMISDEALSEAGFEYDIQNDDWIYKGEYSQARERLTRILQMHIAITFEDELDDLSGEGIYETFGGELIKFKNNSVFAAGNLDSGEVVQVTASKHMQNGVVYYLDKFLNYSENEVAINIEADPEFSSFFEYLSHSRLYDEDDATIKGIASGASYTFLIPSNAAMQQAVDDGWLPADPESEDPVDMDKADRFILTHILNKQLIIADGKREGTFETLYTNIDGDVTKLTVENSPGQITVRDALGNAAHVVMENSNVLANRAVLHQIDAYLK